MSSLGSLHLRRRANSGVEINVISLIDILFVLLVFFMVTTSFTADTSIDIDRPTSSHAASDDANDVLIVALTSAGRVVLPAGSVGSDEQASISEALASQHATRVLLVADRGVPTGRMLEVMDTCSAAGAQRVDLAAQTKTSGHE